MKDLGPAKRIIGMDILKDSTTGKLFLYQCHYIEKILNKFNINESRPLAIPLYQDCK